MARIEGGGESTSTVSYRYVRRELGADSPNEGAWGVAMYDIISAVRTGLDRGASTVRRCQLGWNRYVGNLRFCVCVCNRLV